ncbi:MAG: hypothetical protein HOV97_30875, partial [Nonomuraea sp.]|nr:hypothetical protein [Nonomuraea sp.]
MRVLIVAIGSRSDVAPYVGLGARLHAEGYDVAVAAHDPFRSLVEETGLELRPIPGDVHWEPPFELVDFLREAGPVPVFV